MDVSFGVQRTSTVRPQSKPYEMLGLRPEIAVFLSGMWAFPDLSGTCSLICLHIWNVLDIRLNISERQSVTPNALTRRSGQGGSRNAVEMGPFGTQIYATYQRWGHLVDRAFGLWS